MLGLMMAVALVATAKLLAGDTPAVNPFFGTLSTVNPAELPAKSAELVLQADAKNRLETVANVVKAAVGLNPAAAAAIVGAIAQSSPEAASVAAATAAAMLPDQAAAIARAAAVAAPSKAGKIVEAVARVVPSAFKAVANAVAGVAPGESKAILAGLSAAIPSLQESIAKILASSGGGSPSVSDVLGQVSSAPTPSALNGSLGITSAVQTGPPYVTPPPILENTTPQNGGEVGSGGRNYSGPPTP
jgi:Meckel syndrome type 1 protein